MILVTGGTGYVGSVLIPELLNRGYSVRVLDKLYFGDKHLKNLSGKIEIVQGDIRKPSAAIFEDITAVIHLAGLSNDPTAEFNPKANLDINTNGTKIMAQMAKKYGVKRFVFGSSCSIYDRGLLAEDSLKDEKSLVEPKAAYAVSKYRAERELLKLADKNFCPVILRKGTIFGFSPRMRYDLVVNTMVRDAMDKGKIKVFCGGEQWRPLVDITDAARAHIACLEAPEEKVRGEIFNLSFKNYRVLELAHWVEKVYKDLGLGEIKIEVDYTERKDRSYRISAKKISDVLGFTPTVSVADSIKTMIENIKKWGYTDFYHPRYYNISWMMLLSEMEKILKTMGKIF